MFNVFDGSVGKKTVSLRGVTTLKKDAAREAAQARAERAAHKAQVAAATSIQRVYRGHRDRRRWRFAARQFYDSTQSDCDFSALLQQNRALLVCFEPAADAARLDDTLQRNLCRWDASSAAQRRQVVSLAALTQHLSPLSARASAALVAVTAPALWPDGATKCLLHLVDNGFFRSLRLELQTCSALPTHFHVILGRVFALSHARVCVNFMRELVALPASPAQLSFVSNFFEISMIIAPLPCADFVNAMGIAINQPFSFLLWTLVNSMTLIQPLMATWPHSLLCEYVHVLTEILQRVPAHALADADSLEAVDAAADTDDDGVRQLLAALQQQPASDRVALAAVRPRLLLLLDREFVASCLRVLRADDAAVGPDCALAARLCNQLLRLVVNPADRVLLLGSLAYRPGLIRALWRAVLAEIGPTSQPPSLLPSGIPLLHLMLDCYAHFLITLDDTEFYGPPASLGLSINENVQLVAFLRDAAVLLVIEEPSVASPAALIRPSMVTVLHALHVRDTRRAFCPVGHWLSANAMARHAFELLGRVSASEFHAGGLAGEVAGSVRAQTAAAGVRLLRLLPFTVEFTQRARIFHHLVKSDRAEYADNQGFGGPGMGETVTIRRASLYGDAFDRLNQLGPRLRHRLRIRMVNMEGLDEAGIDGGGLSREFLQEVLKQGFNPNAGFFTPTHDDRLYPSPTGLLLSDNPVAHYEFLGRMLGKALFDGLLVDIPFAGFFLTKLLGQSPYVNDLITLDPQLHQNLLFLKTFAGDFSTLALDFAVTENHLGVVSTRDLVPGGRNIPVTRQNRLRFIYYMADYRLNREIRQQTVGFRRGLAELINPEWMMLFDANELQMLMSGLSTAIDLHDLKLHITYAGVYHAEHVAIRMLWRVLERFSDSERRAFVKFVTSSPRPPLMGFGFLEPPMCVHPGGHALDRLPSAATCMNLLKLPVYESEDIMRDKLLYAINSGAGFELS